GFDAAVGRLILMYLPDPAAALRRAAGLVRPGGLVCFHESDLSYDWAAPMTRCGRRMRAVPTEEPVPRCAVRDEPAPRCAVRDAKERRCEAPSAEPRFEAWGAEPLSEAGDAEPQRAALGEARPSSEAVQPAPDRAGGGGGGPGLLFPCGKSCACG